MCLVKISYTPLQMIFRMISYDSYLDICLEEYYEDVDEESAEDDDWKVDVMIEKDLEDYDE